MAHELPEPMYIPYPPVDTILKRNFDGDPKEALSEMNKLTAMVPALMRKFKETAFTLESDNGYSDLRAIADDFFDKASAYLCLAPVPDPDKADLIETFGLLETYRFISRCYFLTLEKFCREMDTKYSEILKNCHKNQTMQ